MEVKGDSYIMSEKENSEQVPLEATNPYALRVDLGKDIS